MGSGENPRWRKVLKTEGFSKGASATREILPGPLVGASRIPTPIATPDSSPEPGVFYLYNY
jgi:hypothetical protein